METLIIEVVTREEAEQICERFRNQGQNVSVKGPDYALPLEF